MGEGIASRFILPYPVLKLGFYGLGLFLSGNGGCLVYIGAPFCVLMGYDNAPIVQQCAEKFCKRLVVGSPCGCVFYGAFYIAIDYLHYIVARQGGIGNLEFRPISAVVHIEHVRNKIRVHA